MKPTEIVEQIRKDLQFIKFPVRNFVKSCLIYNKREYGIFLLEDINGERYTVKVNSYIESNQNKEIVISIYIKRYASHIPNLMFNSEIYVGLNPNIYPLFTKQDKSMSKFCKNVNINQIFISNMPNYSYVLTKECYYNLGYYLGVHKGLLTYDEFVEFSFQLLVGLQTLHRLGIWHYDIKAANILLCDSTIAKTSRYISYNYNNIKRWILSYDILKNRDLKIIDYGESRVLNDVNIPCETFDNEIKVGLVFVINTMWSKVNNFSEDEKNIKDNFINLLKTCKSSLVDIMFEAEIFTPLSERNIENFHEIMLLPY